MTTIRKLSFGIFVLAIIGSITPLEVTINPLAEVDMRYRLTYDVIPSLYEIYLKVFLDDPNVDQFTFDGEVEITLKAAVDNVQQIVLHANDLDIYSYRFNNNPSITYNSSNYAAEFDKWTIPIPSNFNNGFLSTETDTKLFVKYRGYMRDDMYGFYRSYYWENGKKVWLATTQFQPVHARRAFPCFDEPGFKSNFHVRIERPSHLQPSLSNTHIKESTGVNDKYTLDDFKVTPKMSTYLVAFIVSDYLGSRYNSEQFGTFARPEAQSHTNFSVEFGVKMVKELSEYFAIDYYNMVNVDKMHMAAIPDFSAGAMENWGLLTYRETLILYDPETTPTLSEQRIAAVITHEQLHQWFGDLVTCKWWSHTWENEAFARYFQFMGTAMIYKDWELEEQFVVENLQQSMQLDSTDATHPMTTVVNTKAECQAIFDNISYNKGASVLRMLSYYVGLENYQRILQRYLTDNQYQAVDPQHFFNAIANVTNTVSADFFESWTNQSGFPLVTASLNGTNLKLTQKRFMRSGIDNNKTELYNIPISIAMNDADFNRTSTNFMFTSASNSMEQTLSASPTNYYMVNVQQTGFYRVHYDDDNWNKIKEALMSEDFNRIHVLNRAQVVDDLFNLARGGVVEYSFALDIIHYLKNETHYIPWLSAINHGLTFLSQRVKREDADIFAWYINDLMEKIYQKLSFYPKNNDTRTDIYNRVNILTWLCKYNHTECRMNATQLFDDYVDYYKKVPKDHRVIVYCNAIRYGGDTEFLYLFNKFLTEDVAAEQLNILNALGCSKSERNIGRLLGRLLRTKDIRPQDLNAVINTILNSNPEGVDLLYNFIVKNYDDWKKTFGDLGTLSTVVGRFTTQEQLSKFENFLAAEESNLSQLYGSLSKSIDTAKANIDWDDKYMTKFIEHLHVMSSAASKAISLLLTSVALLCAYLLN